MTDGRASDLDWRLRLGWGIGSLGASTLINGVTFLALYYFSRVLGLSPAVAGALLFLTKLYSILADPLLGVLSDRVRNPAGRRRPFLLVGAVVSTIAFVALFSAPDRSGTEMAIWCGGALLLYATGFSLFIVPYLAMPAEMTDSYDERSRLMSTRVIFASLGILAGGALAPALVAAFGSDRTAYSLMSLVLAAIIGTSMSVAYAGTRMARFTTPGAARQSAWSQLSGALRHAPFAWLISSKFAHLFGVAVSNSSLLFMITEVLGRSEAAAGLFGLAATAGTLASMPLWLRICARLGKRNAYIAAATLYLPVLLSWLATDSTEPAWLLGLRGLAIGLCTGGLTLTAQAMLPDTIEEDARISGMRREGTFAALYSAVEKGASALGPLALGLVLAGTAMDSGPADPQRIRLAAALIPAAATGLSALILIGYRLDHSYRERERRGLVDRAA